MRKKKWEKKKKWQGAEKGGEEEVDFGKATTLLKVSKSLASLSPWQSGVLKL